MSHTKSVYAAAGLLRQADGLLITAGAGMGIDSGLPDFRGDQGFWNAYPALGRAGIGFTEIASPAAFQQAPRRAWGFYGHRLQLYRDTLPHEGFYILREMGTRMARGSFVFTSNVDGQFQKAGFDPDRVAECHGSIHHLQCIGACAAGATWPADALRPEIDAASGEMGSTLPRCPRCGALARPNILMFYDSDWIGARSDAQDERFAAWLATLRRPVVIEIGAGTLVPSVRRQGEALGVPLIRINPREPEVRGKSDVALPMGALDAVLAIQAALNRLA